MKALHCPTRGGQRHTLGSVSQTWEVLVSAGKACGTAGPIFRNPGEEHSAGGWTQAFGFMEKICLELRPRRGRQT